MGTTEYEVFPASTAGLRSGQLGWAGNEHYRPVFPASTAGLRSGMSDAAAAGFAPAVSSRPRRPGSVAAGE